MLSLSDMPAWMMMCVLMLFFKIHDPLTKSLMFEARHALLHTGSRCTGSHRSDSKQRRIRTLLSTPKRSGVRDGALEPLRQ